MKELLQKKNNELVKTFRKEIILISGDINHSVCTNGNKENVLAVCGTIWRTFEKTVIKDTKVKLSNVMAVYYTVPYYYTDGKPE